MAEEVVEQYVVETEFVTVSRMVWRRFKRPMPGLVERILDENRDLADLGLFLPVGTVVLIPIPQPRKSTEPELEPIKLW